MPGQTDQEPQQVGATPVPDLIERYRTRRDAWIAQADELARLRDEVRGSAEREAMEIVTAARRDVRKIVMEARRELLVLSAQVQAALGEATVKTDPATLLHKAGITASDSDRPSLPELPPDGEFESDAGVDDILNEMQKDVKALSDDARALPLQTAPRADNGSAAAMTLRPAPESPAPAAAAHAALRRTLAPESPGLSEAASRALLSPQFPSESVPVTSGNRLRAFVFLFAALGIIVAVATTWWLRHPTVTPVSDRSERSAPAVAEEATPNEPRPAPPANEPTAESVSARSELPVRLGTTSGKLSLVAEAVRDVWVRTTIDGRPDVGRTLVAGRVINVKAIQSIALRVGDAGALVVSVNGGEKRPLGPDGQVVTRQFVVEGSANSPVPPVGTRPEAQPKQTPPLPATVSAPSPSASSSANPVPLVSLPVAPSTPDAAPVTNQVATTASRTPRLESTGAGTISPALAVVAAARQWLDAYYRQDRAAMAALSTENLLLNDERGVDERLPPGLSDVKRTLDSPSVQIAAETAVFTAVMTERSDSLPAPRVSPVSQVWVLGPGGQWRVRQARLVSEAKLNQVFR